MPAKNKSFDALKWVSLAAARESNRPVLTWAHWDKESRALACADGYRLFVARGLKTPDSLKSGAYVELKKSVRNDDGEIGKFPDYQSIVPSVFRGSFTVDVQHMTQAIKLALVYAKDNNHSVRFDVYPETGVIRVSGRSNERGNCETVVQCVGLEWCDSACPAFSVAYNGTYVIDALKGWDNSAVLNFAAASRWTNPENDHPLLMIGDTDDHYAIVMPMGIDRYSRGVLSVPPKPEIEPRKIGYRSPALKDKGAAIRKRNKQARDRALGIPDGVNIRHKLAGSPEAALRNDIENALNLSAIAHGEPKIAMSENDGVQLRIELRSTWIGFSMPTYRIAGVSASNGNQYDGVALSRDLVYSIALAWHWDRQVAPLFADRPNFSRLSSRRAAFMGRSLGVAAIRSRIV